MDKRTSQGKGLWKAQTKLQSPKLARISSLLSWLRSAVFPCCRQPVFQASSFSGLLTFSMDFQYPGAYLTFEVVSFVPYDRNLIDVSLLSPEHVSVVSAA